jgi:hypothetical protein
MKKRRLATSIVSTVLVLGFLMWFLERYFAYPTERPPSGQTATAEG